MRPWTTPKKPTVVRRARTLRILRRDDPALQSQCGARHTLEQRQRTVGLGVAVVLVTMVFVMTARAWESFVPIDLGALDEGSSFALAVSDTGVAVGYSGNKAFRWTQADGMVDLGTLGGNSLASAVNDRGTVTVGASMTADVAQHAFAWTEAAGMVDLGTLGAISAGSYATGVNDRGVVVGFSWHKLSEDPFADLVTRGFVWTPATGMVDIGSFGGDTYPNAINNRGLVVGTSYTAGNATSRPFAWTRDGGLIDLGSLGGFFGEALAVSDSGVVVGYSYTAGDVAHSHPFAWTEERGLIDLGTLGSGTSGSATAVNDHGVVVGYTSTVGNGTLRAFRWTAARGMSDLEPFDGPESYATGVNNDGLVVGNHVLTDGTGLLGFAWTREDGMVDLDPLGGQYSQIVSVASNGLVLGFSYGGASAGHATVWRAGLRNARRSETDADSTRQP